MGAATSKTETIWWLASAGKYRDRPGQGCFSPRELVSTHAFGWDRALKCFVVQDFHGIGGTVHHRLELDPALAEAFFVRCLDPKFREEFLSSSFSPQEAVGRVEAVGKTLSLHRGPYKSMRIGPALMGGLTVSIEEGERAPERLFLSYELRTNFAARIGALSEDEVRRKLSD